MTLQEDALGRSYDAGLMRRMLGYLRPRRGLVAVAVALLIVLRHRSNIVRLFNGTENKFVKKRPGTPVG